MKQQEVTPEMAAAGGELLKWWSVCSDEPSHERVATAIYNLMTRVREQGPLEVRATLHQGPKIGRAFFDRCLEGKIV